jgi:hypothetical protein
MSTLHSLHIGINQYHPQSGVEPLNGCRYLGGLHGATPTAYEASERIRKRKLAK